MKKTVHITRERSSAQVEETVVALAHRYKTVVESTACLLHCKQVHSKGFYDKLRTTFGVGIIKEEGSSWSRKFVRVILGFPAAIVITDANQIQPIFATIVEQAYGGLYFFDRNRLGDFVECAKGRMSQLEVCIEKDSSHVKYFVDEDSAVNSDLIVEVISVGERCDDEFVTALKLGLP
jgi:hypothetical protein